MKFQKLFVALTLLVSYSAYADGDHHHHEDDSTIEPAGTAITPAKAAEVAAHTLETLVYDGLDAAFINHLVSLQVERSRERGAVYKIHGVTAQQANGQSLTVDLSLDGIGKIIGKPEVKSERPAQPIAPIAWPRKDALGLMEDALHFILKAAEVKNFADGLQEILLTDAKDAQGQLIAKLFVSSSRDSRSLVIKLMPNGKFIGYELKAGQ